MRRQLSYDVPWMNLLSVLCFLYQKCSFLSMDLSMYINLLDASDKLQILFGIIMIVNNIDFLQTHNVKSTEEIFVFQR